MNYVNFKALSMLLVSLLIITVSTGFVQADELSDNTSEDVISKVMATYSRLYSASGRITKTYELNAGRNTINGRFAVLRPDKLYVEYTGENRQVTVNDGETLYTYSSDQNRGLYHYTSDMNLLERFILGPEPFFGNILQLMGDNFDIELADMVSGNLILKAKPVIPLQVNFILVAVDPATWTIQAVENFDSNNQLVSQTKYLSFKTAGDSLYFPTKITTSTVLNDDIMVETLEFSRVLINIDIDNERFQKPGNSNTEWISMKSLNLKRQTE